jgi:signal transduction histidine kinase
LVPLDRILAFSPEPTGPHRVRVAGTVTFALAGKFLYLQTGDSAVRVETRAEDVYEPGDQVEAAGFADMTRHVGTLAEAQVRKVGRGATPEAVAITPEEIIALNTTAMTTGQLAKPHDFDGHLVRFRATLLAVQSATDPRQPVRRLTLARGEMILGAILHAGETAALDALRPGSVLELTAIVQLEYTPVEGSRRSLVPSRLDVVLRRAADVVVVTAPSWWTPGRLLAAVAIVVVALGAALFWAWQLRRQVRRKTHELASEMRARRDAAIEFQATLRERNRLAANLHDTLLQTLGGIGFQMEACEAEAAAPARDGQTAVHLPVARRMLDHAVDELRSSVWALRSLPLNGQALPEALRALADRAGAGQAVRIEVQTAGELAHVPDFVAGNLLLAAQEALHNALKHGRPHAITIEARPADRPDWIALTVRDDGGGFSPGAQVGAAQGHFGIAGMRERMERLNGTLDIVSAPGQGTTIRFEVPLRSYDEELA